MRRAFREAIPLLLASIALALVAGATTIGEVKPPPPQGQVYLETALSWENVIWIDARSEAKFQADHIPGALRISTDNFESAVPSLFDVWTPRHRIVVYCDGVQCGLSRTIADRLKQEAGMSDVYVLHGGWDSWQARK